MMHPAPPRLAPRLAVALVACGVLGLAACSGGSAYRLEPEDVARFQLPAVRSAPYPPDSLARVTLVEKSDRFELTLDGGYRDLHRLWSATWRSLGGIDRGAQEQLRTFATLWSYDLSLAALKPEGLISLSKDATQKALRERRAEFERTIQIDVYRFAGSPSGGINSLSLVGANAQVELRDGEGRTYQPTDETREIVEQAFASGGRTIPYQRNIFVFPRVVDGRDILATSDELRLVVRAQTGSAFGGYSFTWTWPAGDDA
jgi:hypothetical protein